MSDLTGLTPRERDVLALVATGLTNEQIADKLHVSHATVKHHIRSLFRKLNVHNRTLLALKYTQEGETS